MGVDARTVGGAIAGLALLLAACGGDDSDADDGEESSGETSDASESEETTTTAPPSPEDEVLAGYQDASDAIVAAYDPADPEHPDLEATHAGQALLNLVTSLTNLQMEGVSVVATSSESDPEVASLAGDTAVVEDCIVEVLETLDPESRERIGEPEDSVAHVNVHMERRDGTWKVVRSEPVGESC